MTFLLFAYLMNIKLLEHSILILDDFNKRKKLKFQMDLNIHQNKVDV